MSRLSIATLLVVVSACEPPTPKTDCAPATTATSAAATATASATATATGPAADDEAANNATLTFKIEGRKVRTLSLQELRARIPPVEFTQHDPYYHQTKTYLALPLAPVLQAGFEGRDIVLEAQHFVLRARDGYTVPLEGKRLVEDGGHIAIDDLDVADGWQPIGKQEADPGPFYLVWSGDDQLDLTVHPRPWQLAEIEVSRFESSFPKVVPEGAGEAAQRGFAIFREQCIRCHAINQQGGKVGPELNVPQSIVEYRDPALLKRYIKNPSSFRYGNMPDNPHLTAGNLDDLIAYFTAMSERKDDPKRGDARGAGH